MVQHHPASTRRGTNVVLVFIKPLDNLLGRMASFIVQSLHGALEANTALHLMLYSLDSVFFEQKGITVGKRNYFTRLITYFTTCKFCNSMT